MVDEALLAEVARLRAENELLKRRARSRWPGRRHVAVCLLVVGCALAALSMVGVWLRVTLLDTDRYVRTVAPIAARPAVQRAVADRLDAAIDQRVDFEAIVRGALPDRAAILAPAIDRGLQSFLRSRIDAFTRSPRFADLWEQVNRRAHARVVALLEGGRSGRLALEQDTVYLDLSPMVERVRTGLQDRRLGVIAAAIPATVDGRIALVEAPALVHAQRGVRVLDTLAILLPLLTVASLAGFVWLSPSRRRAVLVAALGLATAMLLLIAALAVTRSVYLDALGQRALSRAAASDVFDAVTALLRHALRIATGAAAAVALAAFVLGLPLREVWRGVADDSRRAVAVRHRGAFLVGIAAIGGVILLGRNPLTGTDVLVVSLAVVVAGSAVTALGMRAGGPTEEGGRLDPDRDGLVTPEA